MVKSKQQRRANAKRLASQARKAMNDAASATWGSASGQPWALNVEELLELGWRAAVGGTTTSAHCERIVADLADAEWRAEAKQKIERSEQIEPRLAQKILERLGVLWESGWQPLDVVHVVRRQWNPKTVRLVSLLIRADATATVRPGPPPTDWVDQLALLGAELDGRSARDPFAHWRVTERLSLADSLLEGLRILGTFTTARVLAALCDPPSRWGRPTRSATLPSGSPRPVGEQASAKTMSLIRALLAKAEATTFPAEAETFAAKAQELMTRYSIDAAVLDGRHGDDLAAGVRSRRIHLDNPYAKEKVELLATVGAVNRVRVVWDDVYAMATVVGFPADLDVTDMLFTSLLVQAARSLAEASAAIGRGSSPAFRRGFWIAYAVRVGERLDEAKQQAASEAESTYGTSLVPLMAERSAAVASVVEELFKYTKPMKARSVDAQGWHAGRTAADLASLGASNPRLQG
jgi:Protein of unknown function (DUF2786)